MGFPVLYGQSGISQGKSFLLPHTKPPPNDLRWRWLYMLHRVIVFNRIKKGQSTQWLSKKIMQHFPHLVHLGGEAAVSDNLLEGTKKEWDAWFKPPPRL